MRSFPPPPMDGASRPASQKSDLQPTSQLAERAGILQTLIDARTDEVATELQSIPSLGDFADARIKEYLSAKYPGTQGVDPQKTEVWVKYAQKPLYSSLSHPNLQPVFTEPKTQTMSLRQAMLNNAEPWSSDNEQPTEKRAVLVDRDGKALRSIQGNLIELDLPELNAMARTLNIGQSYTDMLQRELPPEPTTAETEKRKSLWTSLSKTRMQLDLTRTEMSPTALRHFARHSQDGEVGRPLGLRYVDAVLNYPDPANRPRVDGLGVVANHLILGATTNRGGGGQTIDGALVIGSSQPHSSPAVVLYTPNAPDDIAYREFSSVDAIQSLVRDPTWKTYFSERMSTSSPDERERITTGRASAAGHVAIKPIDGNLDSARYKASVGFMIAHAQHRSTTNRQVDSIALTNQLLLAYDVATTLADLVPAALAARGLSRLTTKAALKPLSTTTQTAAPLRQGLLGGGGGRNPIMNAAQAPPPPPKGLPVGGAPPPPLRPGPFVTTATVHPTPQPLAESASSVIRPYLRSEALIKGTTPSEAAIDRGIRHAANGRQYITLGKAADGSEQTAEVVPVGKGIWQIHLDGEAAGPYAKFDTKTGSWSVLDKVQLGPTRSKWAPPTDVVFSPDPHSPVVHRNLNTVPSTEIWNASNFVDMEKISDVARRTLHGPAKDAELITLSGQDLAKKTGIPFDETNRAANPAAWTAPDGRIYIAYDSPDYVVNGAIDADKVRSTIVHEYVHSTSADHTGLQAATLRQGQTGLSALNYDEAFVDYFAHQLYTQLYPGRPYKSGYFVAEGSLWLGETVRYMEAAGTMTRKQIQNALFKDPDLFKPLSGSAEKEWLAWGKSGPRI